MRFLRRDPGRPDAPADFWTWWPGARDRVAAAIESGGFDQALIAEISAAVRGVHPDMAWELAPGRAARHAFCISPEGNAELRQVALRWAASAPQPDATWEYHPAKQPSRGRVREVEAGGRRFDLDATRTIGTWDPRRRRLDVRLWIPEAADAAMAIRMQVGFIFLDQLLGEEEVERWIGEIDLLDEAADGLAPDDLKAELERRKLEPHDDATWVVGEVAGHDGRTRIVAADAALKRIDHPFADHHVTVQHVFGIDRMPTNAEAQQLDAEEEDFLRRLGDVAILAGRETAPGTQTLHFVAEDPERMKPAIDAWAQDLPDALSPGLPQRRLKVNFARDMDWAFQRELGSR